MHILNQTEMVSWVVNLIYSKSNVLPNLTLFWKITQHSNEAALRTVDQIYLCLLTAYNLFHADDGRFPFIVAFAQHFDGGNYAGKKQQNTQRVRVHYPVSYSYISDKQLIMFHCET